MTSLMTKLRISLLAASGACWVETTTVSTRTARWPSYSTVTWLLLSGRSQPTTFCCRALGQAIENAMGQGDRQRHQFGRVVAGIAEHQALVAGADLLAGGAFSFDALGDVRALLVDHHHHGAGVGADAHVVVDIAHLANHVAGDVGIVDVGLGGDFAGQDRPRRW